MELTANTCQQARLSRDTRFDGLFFTGVKTTGIFCRPICSAVAPKEQNVTYYPSAAAAMNAGFRPCLRCRPETAPQSAAWKGIESVAAKILRHINDGYLVDFSIADLAEKVGISERYLRDLCQRYAGASPSQLELARKSLLAKQLLFDSSLSIADVAFAAGYNSVRRFNEHWKSQFHKAPSLMRRNFKHSKTMAPTDGVLEPESWIHINIPVAKGFDAASVFSFLATRIIAGSEAIIKFEESGVTCYRRLLQFDNLILPISVSYDPSNSCLVLSCEAQGLKLLPRIIQSVKRVFDVESQGHIIWQHLAKTKEFKQQLKSIAASGQSDIRLPGSFDPFEAAMRAIVGQQVSVKAACTLLTRVTARCSKVVENNSWGLTQALPMAQDILDHDLSGLGLTAARINSLKIVASLKIKEPEVFDFDYDSELRQQKLLAIKGIGPWTVSYLEMRAFSNPDAFPAGDLGVCIALEKNGVRPTEKQVREMSVSWAPWRAYATTLLWKRL